MHLAIIGYGNIAQSVVAWLAQQPVARLSILVRPGALEKTQADPALAAAADRVTVSDQIDTLLQDEPDLVAECAGHEAVATYGPVVLRAGRDLLLSSIGAMGDPDLYKVLHRAAREGSAQLILPPGAIGGIDLLSAFALAGPVDVTYRGTKPPRAWAGTPAVETCDLSGLTSKHVFFSGTAREAAATYPKNANVAATLALAGAGFDQTRVELVADPDATGNSHCYSVESPAGRYTMTIENTPSPGNAKTSMATVFSIIRSINRLRDTVVI